nr:hypothetical protein Iba_chr11bCG8590 [Ipomoea batatas]
MYFIKKFMHLLSTAIRITAMVYETTQIPFGTCINYLKSIKCHEVEMSMTLRCVFTLPPLIGLHIKHLENIFN